MPARLLLAGRVWRNSARLAFEGVVGLEDVGVAGKLHSLLEEDWHQHFAKRIQLLLGIPDLADAHVSFRSKKDVVVEAVRSPRSRLLQKLYAFVGLFLRQF